MYLELKASLPKSLEDRVSASESESSEIVSHHQKLVDQHQKITASEPDKQELLRKRKMKKLRKIEKTLKKKGQTFVFFEGKPILAGISEKKLIHRLHGLAQQNISKYNKKHAVSIQIRTIPRNILKTRHGGVHLYVNRYFIEVNSEKGTSRIQPPDITHSSFRIFYNVDEIDRFSFTDLAKIADATVEKKFKDTGIGHYQFTEVEEILAK